MSCLSQLFLEMVLKELPTMMKLKASFEVLKGKVLTGLDSISPSSTNQLKRRLNAL